MKKFILSKIALVLTLVCIFPSKSMAVISDCYYGTPAYRTNPVKSPWSWNTQTPAEVAIGNVYWYVYSIGKNGMGTTIDSYESGPWPKQAGQQIVSIHHLQQGTTEGAYFTLKSTAMLIYTYGESSKSCGPIGGTFFWD